MTDLLEPIKGIRARTADQFLSIAEIAYAAMQECQSLKPAQALVTHRSRRYVMWRAMIGATQKVARLFREDLFEPNPNKFLSSVNKMFTRRWIPSRAAPLERVVYTAQQSISCYLDFHHPAAARRIVGTVFEALIACSINLVTGLTVGAGTVLDPETSFSVRTDLGIRQENQLRLLIATKTSTRERLSQPFVQKHIVDQVLKTPPKSILVVLGDVQRIGTNRVQHTFTAGQFQLY